MRYIPGYERLYSITSCGRVYSHKRKKFLKPVKDSAGYLKIYLYTGDGIDKSFYIHRLVAQTYLPNPDNLPQVGHRDETRDHDWLNNLYWTDQKSNNNMPLYKQRMSKAKLGNTYAKKKTG